MLCFMRTYDTFSTTGPQKYRLYLWLLGMNLFISAFTFGGGYVVVPMIRKYFVQKKHLFSEDELVEMAAVAQSSPGAIAINLAALSGYKVAGIVGVMICGIAAVFPPLVILSVISHWYTTFASNVLVAAVLRGMQAGVAALIVDFIVDMVSLIVKQKSLFLTLLIPLAFVGNFVLGVNVIYILLGCCVLCLVRVWWSKRWTRKGNEIDAG